MTITNYASDGQFPILIALVRVLAAQGALPREELVRVCATGDEKHTKATLSTWTDLGLFVEDEERGVRLADSFSKRRGETLDELTDRLPAHCLRTFFDSRHALPLWRPGGERSDEEIGPSADFVRELAWALSQDIYSVSFDTGAETIEALEQRQVIPGKHVFVNRTRWPGLGFWARYTGFASADGHTIDPTDAIREALTAIFETSRQLPAAEFLSRLNDALPVVDGGRDRVAVEAVLDPSVWQKPPTDHLSMSLSFALRRLQLDQTLVLEAQADAGQIFFLSGRDFRVLDRFSRVEWQG
jgi:hypothetical protein